MDAVRMLYQLAAADFRERTRRYSFLITLLGTVFFGFLVITGKWAVRARRPTARRPPAKTSGA